MTSCTKKDFKTQKIGSINFQRNKKIYLLKEFLLEINNTQLKKWLDRNKSQQQTSFSKIEIHPYVPYGGT